MKGHKMRISYTTKTFEDIICYWIEATHISFMVSDLVEYTDEVGEEALLQAF